MAKKTAVEKMGAAIGKVLKDYGDDIQANLDDITKKMGQKGAKAVRDSAKDNLGGTGEYAKKWSYQLNKARLYTEATIFNDHPGLPHLLEYGHVTRDGTGRTHGRTSAHSHIAPVAEALIETFQKEVEAKL